MKNEFSKEIIIFVELKTAFKKIEKLGVTETSRLLFKELSRLRANFTQEDLKDADDLYNWKTNNS